MDKTTKALLVAIAVGVWANVLGDWVRPVPVMAQQMELQRLQQEASSIAIDVKGIAAGTCLNQKTCGTR